MKKETSKKETIKAVVSEKIYNIKYITYDNGSTKMERTCDGFSPLELLGLLDFTGREVLDQMRGIIKPNIVERNFIEQKKTK